MKPATKFILAFIVVFSLYSCVNKSGEFKNELEIKPFVPPISYNDAKYRADSIIGLMSLDEKIAMIGGYNMFYTKGFKKYGIPSLYFSDATQGVNIRENLPDQLEKSVAFPSPIALSSTWNTNLAEQYARAIGEECRTGNIAVLLGPGMNIYRISTNGRNFEYFGEDPFLASRMVERYVIGMQSTGTIATLKHFICNNTEYRRRTSNSVVSERALNEIYLPAFEAGINAGAMAVMTSYNMLNDEYTGQSDYVINKLLREQLGFKWLVMSDWWSVWNPEKVIKSGLDLDMPGEPQDWMPENISKSEFYLRNSAKSLIKDGLVEESDINRMVSNLLTTQIAMGLMDRPVKDTSYLNSFDEHTNIALNTAREGIVLLKNNGALPVLPINKKSILLTGKYGNEIPVGGGAAFVKGYDHITLFEALKEIYGEKVKYRENPTENEIEEADVVIASIGTHDSESFDKSFDFPDSINKKVGRIADLNKNTIVVVNSGSGMNMTEWNHKIAGLLYNWYPGQIGFKALAEIISGFANPSGKLPITIEKRFEDSPGYPYIPEHFEKYNSWEEDYNIQHTVNSIVYNEGVFIGYRWYESKNIKPLYAFGYGLSYTNFKYSNLKLSARSIDANKTLKIKLDVENTGLFNGMETVQLYVRDVKSSVSRPLKELKGFKKINLNAGESQSVCFTLKERDFAFWDEVNDIWKVEPGRFEILVGDASDNVLLKDDLVIK